jgi:hypothetical protein
MRIIVHYPKKEEDIRKLQLLVAEMHADTILCKIQKLNCPQCQKTKLMERIIQDIVSKSAVGVMDTQPNSFDKSYVSFSLS